MNKKVIIGIVVAVAVVAIGVTVGAYYFLSNKLIPAKDQGNTGNGKQQLLEKIKNTENETVKRDQINFVLEQNIITQEEANELY